MVEVLKCDNCGWEVPASNQEPNTKCWSCVEGKQRKTDITLEEHNGREWKKTLRKYDFILNTRGL